jgi:transcriptional regulator with XRE-family HTH domain
MAAPAATAAQSAVPIMTEVLPSPGLWSISYRIYCGMTAIRTLRQASGLTQAALAQAGGTSQPTIAAYEAGNKSPTLATVDRLARGAGLEATVMFHPPMTREDRRSLALHRAIAHHLQRDPAAVLERARQTLARMESIASRPSQPIREWSVLLDRPLTALLEVLTDPSPWARELRHVTPFAGVLPTGERAEVFRVFAEAEQEGRRL